MTAPTYLPYYVMIGSVAMIAAVLFGLDRVLRAAHWPSPDRRTIVTVATLVLVAWFAAAVVLSVRGLYRVPADGIPTIQYAILLPIVIGALLFWRSPLLARIIDAVPQPWLVGVQFYRVLGVIFVVLYADGRMPGLFAVPAGLGDLLVGLLAPLVAWLYARHPDAGGPATLGWNILGIIDLVVAVATGFLTTPSSMQAAAFDRPNELIVEFPLALIPVFLVPLSILLHLASLAKLRHTSRAAAVITN